MEPKNSKDCILRWPELSPEDKGLALPQFKEIFYLTSSRKQFSSSDERDLFWRSWTQYYFDHEPQYIYLAFDESGKVCGYLTGCENSARALDEIKKSISSYECFSDQFGEFPAHLHINCHPNRQGQGWGRRLVEKFVEDLASKNIRGVHLITSPGEENVHFYSRLNFTHQLGRHWNNHPLLFMGRNL